jgi:predicted GNAT family acetyltransferase
VRPPDVAQPGPASYLTQEKVEREDGASKGRYRLLVDGVEAEMTYSRAGKGLIIIDHTDVPAVLRGRKIGERLVRQAIEDCVGHRQRVVSSARQRKAEGDVAPPHSS